MVFAAADPACPMRRQEAVSVGGRGVARPWRGKGIPMVGADQAGTVRPESKLRPSRLTYPGGQIRLLLESRSQASHFRLQGASTWNGRGHPKPSTLPLFPRPPEGVLLAAASLQIRAGLRSFADATAWRFGCPLQPFRKVCFIQHQRYGDMFVSKAHPTKFSVLGNVQVLANFCEQIAITVPPKKTSRV